MAPGRPRKQRHAPRPGEAQGSLDFSTLLPTPAPAGSPASIGEALVRWLEQGC